MLVKAFGGLGAAGQVIVGIVVGAERAALQERNGLIQHAGVAAAQHIAAGGKDQPQVIIGTMGAHAPAGGRMAPPDW